MTVLWMLGIPLAYLLGTLPSAQLVARRRGRDPLAEGSRNPGATNVARLVGWRGGVVVLLVDFAKGALPTLAGLALGGRGAGLALGAASVVGHIFPVTRRFRGGKGVATATGVLVVLFPLICAGAAVVFFVVVRITHTASIASLVIAIGVPIVVAVLGAPWLEVVTLAALGALVVIRHVPNLRRLLRGDELGLGPGSVRADEEDA